MKQRIQVTVLLIIIAALGWIVLPQLMGEESLLGPRRERERAQVPFQAGEVPVIAMATPGPLEGETFDRERVDIFSYEVDPEIKRQQDIAEAERRRLAEEARKKKAEADRIAAAEAARKKAEQDRLARAQAEKDRLARLRALENAEPPPPEEPPKPVPPDFPYRYDGLVGPRADAIAILRDREDDFAYARAGQVLDEVFRIERVGQLKLVLSYVDPLFAGEFSQVPLRPEEGGIGSKPTVRR